jgi:hypothetical protein
MSTSEEESKRAQDRHDDEAAARNSDVMGGPQPTPPNSDVMGGRQPTPPGSDVMGGPEDALPRH